MYVPFKTENCMLNSTYLTKWEKKLKTSEIETN